MKRREFLTLTAGAAVVAPVAAFAGKDYVPGMVRDHLAAGDTVFLDFKASWCTTCAAQERVINALKSKNPEYGKKIVFIDVDWDEYGRSDIVKELRIPRRSTLVVLKGNQELGRVVAQTGQTQIKKLMDLALNA
jgi:thiol-disulfide isomerase/thioredoxin